MKKTKWITSLLAFSVMSILCVQFADYNAKQKYIEVFNGFSIPVNNYIISAGEFDVDGDGKPDKVYAYGEKKSPETEYAERINLAVVYAKNGFVKKTNVSHIKGYVAELEVQDFTGNKNKGVMLKTFADQNKSVLCVYVADFGADIPKTILADSRGLTPSLKLSEGFVVNCSLLEGENFSVNLENRKDSLIEKGLFDESGKPVFGKKAYILPFYEAMAVDYDKDKKYEINGTQKVVAGEEETELFKISSVQKYIDRRWDLVKIEIKY